jgi:cytochrome c oxidase cbb3-type subunit III
MRTRTVVRVWMNMAAAIGVAAIGVVAQTPPAGGGQPGGRGAPAQAAANPCGPTTPARGGGMLAGAGPADKPPVDPAAADRAKPVYAAECLTCHGTMARGTAKGSNLIRSLVVLRDRCGSELGPFLKGAHKAQSPTAAANLTAAQIFDLAHYLRQRVNDSLRGSPLFVSQNVLTGDPEAGLSYFEGEGKCTTCHSIKGDLAGIGRRLEPIDLQQRMLFPGAGRGGRRGAPAPGGAPSRAAVTVTVTPPGQPAVSGVLVQMDDFNVALRDGSGTYRSFKRTAGLQIVKNDPLAFHHGLLDRLSDKNMHDLVAYLEKVK